MKNKSSFVTVAMAVVVLLSACVLGPGLDADPEPTPWQATAVPEEELEYEEISAEDERLYDEHGFTQSPGDYWIPIVLPNISESEQ